MVYFLDHPVKSCSQYADIQHGRMLFASQIQYNMFQIVTNLILNKFDLNRISIIFSLNKILELKTLIGEF